MIKVGADGTLCLFWADILISGFPLGSYNYQYYKDIATKLITDSLRENISIDKQIKAYHRFCDLIWNKKIRGKRINSENHQYFMASVLALVKLRKLDEDEVVFVAPRKKTKKLSKMSLC